MMARGCFFFWSGSRASAEVGNEPGIQCSMLKAVHGATVSEQLSLLASHQGDTDSIPGRVTSDFCMWESCRTMPFVCEFYRDLQFPLSFRRCSILTSITLTGSRDLNVELPKSLP
ncbi:hypothetical protein PR048_029176 [Dryococelus australis]|uniref:Secreted protein n=1 Tax=Dryococelus australis TaxID=614101 RepID=A0ABQ9GFF4_9NEOP|nr:hypothetical protein PR048_029176 [Dryococelus australis]